MTDRWFFIDGGPGEPAFNMALDDALLRHAEATGVPVLRRYSWTQPAATFGYFQRIAEIEAATLLRPLIRRPTGGGLVPHISDWTYSLTVPSGHPWHRLRAEESYARMHEWLQSAFAALGIPTELATCCRKEIAGQCFVGHEKFDLLCGGRKIAGAAQRRNKLGLLIQGSIQPVPSGITSDEFSEVLLQTGERFLGLGGKRVDVDKDLVERARQLAEERYSRIDHNRRR